MELTSKAKILVLYVNPYDMLNERGERLSGVSVQYLFWGEGGETLVGQSEWDVTKAVGVQRGKCSMDAALRAKMPIAPALYEADMSMTVGGDGKAVAKIVDVAFLANVKFESYVLPGLVIPGMKVQEQPQAEKPEPKTDAKK